MAVKKNGRREWQKYFDTFSLKYTRDEVMSENLVVHREMQWMLLKGITYESKSDLLEIQVDKMEHLISQPKEIYVEEVGGGWMTDM